MQIVTLDQAKQHLQILNNDQDTYITLLANIAEDYVKNILDDRNPPVAPAIQGAVLMVVADMDANRATTVDVNLQENKLFMNLLQPYRKRIGV